MNTFETTLAADQTLEVPFVTEMPGVLSYRIFAAENVDSFLVDLVGRDRYRRGEQVVSSAAETDEKMHFRQAPLSAGQWFILIRNKGNKAIRVQAEIEFLAMTRDGYGVPTGSIGGILSGSGGGAGIFGKKRT